MQDFPADTITDLHIEALVDRQLGAQDRKIVFGAMRRNPALHAKYRRLVQQRKILRDWWMDARSRGDFH